MSNPTQEQINEYVTLTKEKMSQSIREQIAHYEKEWRNVQNQVREGEALMLQLQGAISALQKLEQQQAEESKTDE